VPRGSVVVDGVPALRHLETDFLEFAAGAGGAFLAPCRVGIALVRAENVHDGGIAVAAGVGVRADAFDLHGGIEILRAAGHDGEDLILLGLVEVDGLMEALHAPVGFLLDAFGSLVHAVAAVGSEAFAVELPFHEAIDAIVPALISGSFDEVFEAGTVGEHKLLEEHGILIRAVAEPLFEFLLLLRREVVFAGVFAGHAFEAVLFVAFPDIVEEREEVAQEWFGGVEEEIHVDLAAGFEIVEGLADAAAEGACSVLARAGLRGVDSGELKFGFAEGVL